MYDPVVCTCGRDLGSLMPIWIELKTKEYEKNNLDTIEKLESMILSTQVIELGHILDKLGLLIYEADCCRFTLTTNTKLIDKLV